jgi:hypothetical protein
MPSYPAKAKAGKFLSRRDGFAPEKPAEFVTITIARLIATGTAHRR